MSGGLPIVGNYPTSSYEYYQLGHLWNDTMIKKNNIKFVNIISNITFFTSYHHNHKGHIKRVKKYNHWYNNDKRVNQ